jgi:hypothetical protein
MRLTFNLRRSQVQACPFSQSCNKAVKNYQFKPGYVTYLVEMEMGPEPEMGRIGQETTVCLFESDLKLRG